MVATADRRLSERRAPHDERHLRVRIRAGREARVINHSRRGLLLATPMRLLPGRRCVITWPLLPGAPAAGGLVVRSSVGRVDAHSGVTYHVALQLDADVPELGELAAHTG